MSMFRKPDRKEDKSLSTAKINQETKEIKEETPRGIFDPERQALVDKLIADLLPRYQERISDHFYPMKPELISSLSETYHSTVMQLSSYVTYDNAKDLLAKIAFCLPILQKSFDYTLNGPPFGLSRTDILKAIIIPLIALGLTRLGLLAPNTALALGTSSLLYQGAKGIFEYQPVFKLDAKTQHETNTIFLKLIGKEFLNTHYSFSQVIMLLPIFERILTDIIAAKDYKKTQRMFTKSLQDSSPSVISSSSSSSSSCFRPRQT